MRPEFAVVWSQLKAECVSARDVFPRFYSRHEAIAVIREEYLELEEAIFRNRDTNVVRMEALQVAAMAVLLVYELESGVEWPETR
jgi:hypothetical protein